LTVAPAVEELEARAWELGIEGWFDPCPHGRADVIARVAGMEEDHVSTCARCARAAAELERETSGGVPPVAHRGLAPAPRRAGGPVRVHGLLAAVGWPQLPTLVLPSRLRTRGVGSAGRRRGLVVAAAWLSLAMAVLAVITLVAWSSSPGPSAARVSAPTRAASGADATPFTGGGLLIERRRHHVVHAAAAVASARAADRRRVARRRRAAQRRRARAHYRRITHRSTARAPAPSSTAVAPAAAVVPQPAAPRPSSGAGEWGSDFAP
jgi:hypothetical protein